MKCWNSSFNSQGSRLIILIVQVRAMQIYVAAVEVLMKKKECGWRPHTSLKVGLQQQMTSEAIIHIDMHKSK